MDYLAGSLKKGGIKDLLAFFPPNKRDRKTLEDHFRKEGLPQISEWYSKKHYGVVKAELVKTLKELCEKEDTPDQVSCFVFFSKGYIPCIYLPQIIAAIKSHQEELPLPQDELVQCIWQGLMSSVDWSARPDQIEGLALREVGVSFCFDPVECTVLKDRNRNMPPFSYHSVTVPRIRSL